MIKIIRATTIPKSLDIFCKGLLKELSVKYEVIALSSHGDDLDRIAEREGVRTKAIPMERRISIVRDLKSLIYLFWLFWKEKPTMVHSMTPKAGLLCMVAAWMMRVPVRVHTFTGLVFPTSKGLKRKLLMLTDTITCVCATHIIPEGEGVKSDLVMNRITRKPLKVLGYGNVMGVDMKKFSRRKEVLNIANTIGNGSYFTFLYVGRIVKDKGINELMSAFERLSRESNNVRLWLVGSFEDSLDPISEKAKDIIHNNPGVEYVGSRYEDELLAYYAAADCFVFPSYREGFPNTVLEAGAMGLPSIVTDINGSREIIKQGENGVIIPSQNAEALYHAMKNMIADHAAREYMASNARKMVGDRFEQSFVRKCLYDFYDEILAPFSSEPYDELQNLNTEL